MKKKCKKVQRVMQYIDVYIVAIMTRRTVVKAQGFSQLMRCEIQRLMVVEEDFVLWNGNRAQIKRIQFERYLDSKMNVI